MVCKLLNVKRCNILHLFFFNGTHKHFIEITFIKNQIFYMAVHSERVSIVTHNITFLLGTKFDAIFMIASLKTKICLLTCNSASADSQSNKSTAIFI